MNTALFIIAVLFLLSGMSTIVSANTDNDGSLVLGVIFSIILGFTMSVLVLIQFALGVS